MTNLPARSFRSASINSGGSAYDRQIPVDDHNPLTGLLDFDNTQSVLDDAADAAAKQFQDNLVALIKALTGIDLTDPQTLVDGIGQQINDFIQANLDTLQVGWDQIIGQLPTWKLGPIPIGVLVADMLNQLIDGSFSTNSIKSPTGRWVVDNTVYRDMPGSARVAADGTATAIRSNKDRVFMGQKIDVRAHVAAVGLTGVGSLIELWVVPYSGATASTAAAGTPVLLQSWSAGGSPNAQDWTAPPSGTVALYDMEQHWTVPNGVDWVATRLAVTANATAGTLWWDEAFQAPDGLSLETWLDGIGGDLAAVWASFEKTGTDFGDFFTALIDFVAGLFGGQPPAVVQARFDTLMDALNLLGEDFSTSLNAATDTFVNAFMLGGSNDNGLTALTEDSRKSINWVLNQLGFGYLNDAWVWTSGTPDVDDLPESGWTNLGAAPEPWIANILNAFGIATSNDLPSQLDPTIPASPLLSFLSVQVSSSTSVPQGGTLYYVVTATKDGKESAPSNEMAVYISPANAFWPKAQVTVPWFAVAGADSYSVYRRPSPNGQYRRVASGLTSTSYPDVDPSNAVTTQPGSAAASVAGVINGIGTGVQAVADGIHQAINGDSATDTPQTASAIKANLTAIPPANITAQSYAAIAYSPVAPATTIDVSIPAGSSTYITSSKITTANAFGDSIGANKTNGLWIAEPGLYSLQTIISFKGSAGLSFNGALTPTFVYGDTAPPTSGTWTDSHTLPCGTSATVADASVTYFISGNNTYIRTDTGNRYFTPGLLWSNGSGTAATINIYGIAIIAIKLSN